MKSSRTYCAQIIRCVGGSATALMVLLGFANLDAARAGRILFQNDDYQIYQDFADLTVSPKDKNPSAFFNVGPLRADFQRLALRDSESMLLEQKVNAALGALFNLRASRAEADYIFLVRMAQYQNYAIRNSRRVPASSEILIGFCKLNSENRLAEVNSPTDCRIITFHFFIRSDFERQLVTALQI